MLPRPSLVYVAVLVFLGSALAGAQNNAHAGTLTAEQIVEKNAAARGGLQAWRAVQSITLSGQMEGGGTQKLELPFLLEMKRPRKSRLELKFAGQTAVQVYDGVHGWKLRPYLGRNDVEEYTAEELKEAASQSDLDGPLIDSAAKGNKVALEGMEKVRDRDTYRLKITLPNSQVRRVWVDAQTFLDVKIEGLPRRLDGKLHPVEIAFGDYRSVHGLMIPCLLETTVREAAKIPGKGLALQDVTSKIVIENVVWNPQLADSRFAKPQADGALKVQEAQKVSRPLP
jgi:outer membrane lipoprotein-sorting protein